MAVNSFPKIYKVAGDAERLQLQWKIGTMASAGRSWCVRWVAPRSVAVPSAPCAFAFLSRAASSALGFRRLLSPHLAKNSEQCMELKHQTEMKSLFSHFFLFLSFCSNI